MAESGRWKRSRKAKKQKSEEKSEERRASEVEQISQLRQRIAAFLRYHQLPMKQAVFRERNKRYYRVLHTPIWIWVFWVLPGYPLTYDLYTHGPDRRHWIWLAIVLAVVAWRGLPAACPDASRVPTSRTTVCISRTCRIAWSATPPRGSTSLFRTRLTSSAWSSPPSTAAGCCKISTSTATIRWRWPLCWHRVRLDAARAPRYLRRRRRAGLVLRRHLDGRANAGHQLGRVALRKVHGSGAAAAGARAARICLMSTALFFFWDTPRSCRATSGTMKAWQRRECEEQWAVDRG